MARLKHCVNPPCRAMKLRVEDGAPGLVLRDKIALML